MEWTQVYDPLDNRWLSALVACLPIVLFFVSLIVFKLKGYTAGLLTVILTALIAIFVYGMPASKVGYSFLFGALYGLWPIAWIIIAAIFLYKLTVKSGYFDILRESIIAITPDQRIQVILIGFCFGAFLEGAVGFGGPVAITAALLVGLGLRPLYAAGLCLIANTAPVAFGAVGIPIIAMAGVVDTAGFSTSEYALKISSMVGHMLAPLSVLVPFFLIFLMDGLKGLKETWPVALVAGGSFTIVQYYTATRLGPELCVLSAITSIVCVAVFLRFWQPKNIFKFENNASVDSDISQGKKYSTKQIILAWMPFIILIFMIVIWTQDWFKDLFASAQYGTNANGEMELIKEAGILNSFVLQINFSELGSIIQTTEVARENKVMKSLFDLPLINTVGTSIFIAALITMVLLKVKITEAVKTFGETLNEMKFAILTISLVVGFAYISNYSGILATLALALANTGEAFVFFSPIVGWLGVFLTGSDASSNILFGTLQQLTANKLGISDILFLAANCVGGVIGKMISPQSIVIACAAVGLVGRESELFRFTAKYSVALVIIVGFFTYAMAFWFPWIMPN